MKVLKNIRRKKQVPTMSFGIGSKKHLNYSTVSNGSGNTVEDDSDDMIELFSPLHPQESKPNSSSPEALAKAPEAKLSLFHDNSKPLVKKTEDKTASVTKKRVPADPIAPLGTVVNDEDEWDSISHISGISNHTSSSAKSPTGTKINVSDDIMQEEMDKMNAEAAATSASKLPRISAPKPITAVVSPVVEDTVVTQNHSSPIMDEVDKGHVSRMLKRFDDSESISKNFHIFEDDQESQQNTSNSRSSNNNNNLMVIRNTATSPVYSEKVPMPHAVSPDKSPAEPEADEPLVMEEALNGTDLMPAFEAVVQEKLSVEPEEEEKQSEHNYPVPALESAQNQLPPDLGGAIAPSFDGSTCTEFTDNTTFKKSGTDSIATAATEPFSITTSDDTKSEKAEDDKDDQASVISDKIHEKLSSIEESMRSACSGIGEMKKPEMPECNRPNCDSLFSSTQALKENLRDSLQTIQNELSGAYSGLSTATSVAVATAKQESMSYFRKDHASSRLDASHEHSQYLEEEILDDELDTIPEESYTTTSLNSSNITAESLVSGRKSVHSRNEKRYNDRNATMASF